MNSIKSIARPPRIGSPLIAGVIYSIIWLAIGALLLSCLLYFSNMKENNLPQYSLAIHGFSALAGGFVSGKRSGMKGWYHGALLGLIYGITVLTIGFLAANSGLSGKSAIMLLAAMLAGAFGGMIGVNLKK
ncbi:TIGR04086 family membrane protein [Paenibacillus glycanilyticus]|uniref:Membrane protein YrzE n=1 Tax=Paenibacillus glycanilyticus TaxID=126569 RepID=A0ABQ6NRT5_9BACL|nr:TIGR04086 family membrane protein [Paenibacillus glycanilyticus]GMK47245.1 putative membrane protein YrzE [Paenibacillus glycanilyticus]